MCFFCKKQKEGGFELSGFRLFFGLGFYLLNGRFKKKIKRCPNMGKGAFYCR